MKANELKVTDLMVGDWVMSFDAPHKVVGMRTDMIEPHIKTDMSDTWYEEGIENLLEPIPLTPEILEKSGFEHGKQKVISPSRIQDEVELEYFYCKDLRCSFDIIHGYLMFNSNIDVCNIRMVVTYVHELQHALKLCGIDKEIVV